MFGCHGCVAWLNLQDVRFDWLVDHFKPKSVVPGALTVCDIAGLVKGAAAGKGLGNEFLSHIAAVDAIFHVCRGFPGEKVSARSVAGGFHASRTGSIVCLRLITIRSCGCEQAVPVSCSCSSIA